LLATLKLTMGPRTVIAELDDKLIWHSEDLLTQTYLNACHGPPEPGTLSMGPVGYQQVTKAARAVEDAGWDVNLDMPGLNQSAA